MGKLSGKQFTPLYLKTSMMKIIPNRLDCLPPYNAYLPTLPTYIAYLHCLPTLPTYIVTLPTLPTYLQWLG